MLTRGACYSVPCRGSGRPILKLPMLRRILSGGRPLPRTVLNTITYVD